MPGREWSGSVGSVGGCLAYLSGTDQTSVQPAHSPELEVVLPGRVVVGRKGVHIVRVGHCVLLGLHGQAGLLGASVLAGSTFLIVNSGRNVVGASVWLVWVFLGSSAHGRRARSMVDDPNVERVDRCRLIRDVDEVNENE